MWRIPPPRWPLSVQSHVTKKQSSYWEANNRFFSDETDRLTSLPSQGAIVHYVLRHINLAHIKHINLIQRYFNNIYRIYFVSLVQVTYFLQVSKNIFPWPKHAFFISYPSHSLIYNRYCLLRNTNGGAPLRCSIQPRVVSFFVGIVSLFQFGEPVMWELYNKVKDHSTW